jgi:methionine-rich copper-binding protein CopC
MQLAVAAPEREELINIRHPDRSAKRVVEGPFLFGGRRKKVPPLRLAPLGSGRDDGRKSDRALARRAALLALLVGLAVPTHSWAQAIKVVETGPAANAVIDRLPADGVFVRFDKPVDHIHSILFIKRGGTTIQTLHPRFKTEPQVLFANAPPLPPGDYTLAWSVITLEDKRVAEGEIPFTIAAGKRP